jgi:hypothetical protein
VFFLKLQLLVYINLIDAFLISICLFVGMALVDLLRFAGTSIGDEHDSADLLQKT